MSGEFTTGPELHTTFYKIGGQVRPVQYTIVDGLAVVEGCLILGTEQEAKDSLAAIQNNPGLLRSGVSTMGSAILGENYRWPNKQVPYEIAAALPHPERVTQAIEHWQTHTTIRFVPRTAANTDYVAFVPGSGCMSSVGRRGGRQLVTLGDACTAGNCIHEIGHTLGLWHEQSRIDRDAHITILWQNIMPGMESNFYQQLHDSLDVGNYDFGSIMHYPLEAFSKNQQPTIQVVGAPPAGAQIGQRTALSAGDLAAIADIYP